MMFLLKEHLIGVFFRLHVDSNIEEWPPQIHLPILLYISSTNCGFFHGKKMNFGSDAVNILLKKSRQMPFINDRAGKKPGGGK